MAEAEKPSSDTAEQAVSKGKAVARIAGFFAAVCALVALLSSLFVYWTDDAHVTIRGIYAQPRDSVEVIFVGASSFRWNISPLHLYETHGISSYGLGTASQPTMAAYYLILDALRNQSGSLTTVVLDVSPILNTTEELTYSEQAERVSANMEMSPVKLEFLWMMSQEYDDVDFFEQVIPILRFHERWYDLKPHDFEKVYAPVNDYYARGQTISLVSNVSEKRGSKFTSEANLAITDERELDEARLEELWNPTCVRWFERIVDLCRDHGLNLLLLKTPSSSWDDTFHDSAVLLASRYGVPLLDMSAPDVFTRTGIVYSTDFRDDRHANVVGSLKISESIGDYLVENYELSDVRNDSRYDYYRDGLAWFALDLEDAQLLTCKDFEEYLSLINRDRYTVLIATSGEAADGLTDTARERLFALGFTQLAQISEGASYVGVVDGGVLVAQKYSAAGDALTLSGSYADSRATISPEENMQPSARFDVPLVVTSPGSKTTGATISVGPRRLAEGGRGIAFVVYNRDNGMLVDTSIFDTHGDCARTCDIAPEER